MTKHAGTAHMEGMAYPTFTGTDLVSTNAPRVMEVDSSAPFPQRPDFVPGALWAYGKPRTDATPTGTMVSPKTAEFYDTQNRTPVTHTLGAYAGADWMPEAI